MRSSSSVAVACLAASVSAHGVVTKVTGANGVEMPGLTGKPTLDIYLLWAQGG